MRDAAIEQKVIRIAQELLAEEKSALSAAAIDEAIDGALSLHKGWRDAIDRDAVLAELIRRYSMWIGQSTTLKSESGHSAWLNAQRKSSWRYWQRYRQFLERKTAESAVNGLDKVTDEILGLLEDPQRDGSWDRRGLVVGHVQSGKTSNYTGLICKAADAGYKIIVVLAGIHNNLRSQTQMRLDEGFLGYETSPNPDAIQIIGVGEIDGDPSIRPNYVTNRSNNGDFNTALANKLGISPEQRPWLFVVKKNKTVLERLNKWVANHVANSEDPKTGRRVVTNLPLLVIDDEADNASIDTGADVIDENGVPDPEHQPKIINSLIRRLLIAFSKSAYVGYTATPFANIFIHERGETTVEGPDLFPAAFIVNLAAPSNYIGPAKVFGTPYEGGRTGGLPVVRRITDSCSEDKLSGWMPPSHKSYHIPRYDGALMPPSLMEAVDAFMLSCALRSLRGQGEEHSSMLIHVTRFTNVQHHVYNQVEEYVRRQKQRLTLGIDNLGVLANLKSLFEKDFTPSSAKMSEAFADLEIPPPPLWSEVEKALPLAVADIDVRQINGTAKDALDYADTKGPGLKVIAIGGDKLSRGLTLEGLSVSYFLRSSKMYDTLMQMGRWFGYRPGYADLCRLYCTGELQEWFEHIADASEELREEFDAMAASGSTPREFGLRVQSHPVLMVTSPLKMRTSRTLMLSFSGQIVETVSMPVDPRQIEENYRAFENLIRALGSRSEGPKVSRQRDGATTSWNASLWSAASGEYVVDFLNSYATSKKAHKVRSQMLAQFISSMMAEGELRSWTIAVAGSTAGRPLPAVPGIGMVERATREEDRDDKEAYRFGRLLSPRDETIDLDDDAWARALTLTKEAWKADPARQRRQQNEPTDPNGPAIRKVRQDLGGGTAPSGLMLLYAIDPKLTHHPAIEKMETPVIAMALSFPSSNSGTKVAYDVTNLYWELEYGSAE